MTVYDLNEDQLAELKQRYYAEKTGRDLSYGEIVNIDELVSWREIRDAYKHVDFVPDDFFCSAGEEEPRPGCVTINFDDERNLPEILNDIARLIEEGYYSGLTTIESCSWSIDFD